MFFSLINPLLDLKFITYFIIQNGDLVYLLSFLIFVKLIEKYRSGNVGLTRIGKIKDISE
jgi:hypothetical protein